MRAFVLIVNGECIHLLLVHCMCVTHCTTRSVHELTCKLPNRKIKAKPRSHFSCYLAKPEFSVNLLSVDLILLSI